MLKSKKKNSAGNNAQRVYSKGNILRRHWLSALLVSVISIGAGFAYLILVHGVAIQNAQIQRVVDNIAETQAANLQLLFRSYEERLLAAASSPLAMAAIATGNTDDIALVEKTMLDYFPGATSLRLITIGSLGTAGLEGSDLGLRNHIEVDLLRRTGEGTETAPESYQFEGSWLTSLATGIDHGEDDKRSAIVLATFDNHVISDSLSDLNGGLGQTSLQQIFRKGSYTRFDEIASSGTAAAGQFQSSVTLNGGNWTLVFTPSPRLIRELQVDYLATAIVLAAVLLVVLIAMLIQLFLYQRSLAAEV